MLAYAQRNSAFGSYAQKLGIELGTVAQTNTGTATAQGNNPVQVDANRVQVSASLATPTVEGRAPDDDAADVVDPNANF